jgi:WD40 repeat protein
MRGHTDSVEGVAFFNDGCRVVTGSRDKTLRIWNVQKGTLLGEPILQAHEESVFSVAVSPDDKRIAGGGRYGTIMIWDVERKQIVFKLVKHTWLVNCVCFSPDGKRLASGSNDATAVIWDTKTGTVLTVVTEPVHEGFFVLSVAFSPDGQKLASRTGNGIIQFFAPITRSYFSSLRLMKLGFAVLCGLLTASNLSPHHRTTQSRSGTHLLDARSVNVAPVTPAGSARSPSLLMAPSLPLLRSTRQCDYGAQKPTSR